MRHDFNAMSNRQSTFERAFMVNNTSITDRHFPANQYLMPALEAVTNRGVRVNDGP